MTARLTTTFILVAVAFGGGYWLSREPASPQSDLSLDQPRTVDENPFFVAVNDTNDGKPANGELAQLRQHLQTAQAERRQLAAELEALRLEVAALARQTLDADPTATPPVRRPTPPNAAANAQPAMPRLSEEEALMTVGLDTAAVERIGQRLESIEMERLYLRDQAQREGWIGTERYTEAQRALTSRSDVLREELGEEGYDRYLFETGRPNRVMVQSVLAGSPAEQAAIQPGDVVVRYDDARVFSWRDLTSAAAEGTAGQPVRVEVQRDGQTLSVYLPRGPLGVRLGSERAAP